MTRLVTTTAELAAVGRPGSRAVVMTMGALHAGHVALVRRAVTEADQVVVTIFVNPLQFGPGEDLDRYPRTLDADLKALEAVLRPDDVVFAPSPQVMYPRGEPSVRVAAGPISKLWEGTVRPGHFDGVLTVVLKLLHLTAPDVALFGRKDAQQLAAIRQMVADLDVPVRIIGVDTVRDQDGLALSSRNAYLDDAGRTAALSLSAALRDAAGLAAAGAAPGVLRKAARERMAAAGVVVDYVAVVDPVTFASVPEDHAGDVVVAVAGRVGDTRLIDNTSVVLDVAGSAAEVMEVVR